MSVVTLDRVVVEGHTSRGFEAVREAFAGNFAQRGELGGACCVYCHGEKVVGSLGFADPETGVGYAYVTSQMGTTLTGDPRDVALRDALYSVLRE